MAEVSATLALWKFFGLRDDSDQDPKTARQEFMQEVKELSDEDKQELAELSAKELGMTLKSAPG